MAVPLARARWVADGAGGAIAFFDGEEEVQGEIRESFIQAAGPPDFEQATLARLCGKLKEGDADRFIREITVRHPGEEWLDDEE
jgi:hypothetical protein